MIELKLEEMSEVSFTEFTQIWKAVPKTKERVTSPRAGWRLGGNCSVMQSTELYMELGSLAHSGLSGHVFENPER